MISTQRYTDEQKAKAVGLLCQGKSLKVAASVIGCSVRSVWGWSKDAGVQLAPVGNPKARVPVAKQVKARLSGVVNGGEISLVQCPLTNGLETRMTRDCFERSCKARRTMLAKNTRNQTTTIHDQYFLKTCRGQIIPPGLEFIEQDGVPA